MILMLLCYNVDVQWRPIVLTYVDEDAYRHDIDATLLMTNVSLSTLSYRILVLHFINHIMCC